MDSKEPREQESAPRTITCLIASAINHFPLLPQTSKTSCHESTLQKLKKLQESAAVAADQWLNALASQNPLIQRFAAISADLQSFSKIHLQSPKKLDSISNNNFAAILPGDSVAGIVVANGISNFLNIYSTVLVVRLVLTWFPNSPPAIVNPLSTLCDPYLNIFRGLIPPLGGLDLSPILAFMVLNIFTSTAAALPAELPMDMANPKATTASSVQYWNLNSRGKLWLKRFSNKGFNKGDKA
ncbi:ylmG homolog protein 2, chloroplastic [Amborella trichopoda]|uniref:YGGT family protein n=1 Tax=Amborella trichopoda TaxID=13333 RepID=W1PUA8_AMBTC|nr:ylmG homolog protein 2, chloroplastic [Amborella trichopoda]ERN11271.1 hypothetical protein AMTR_s00024p00238310 [Amborella trichopoda]|eukprot:XP_006849690.1 ylmG homolog protein 2, chloroplastic [Amborella trichopoda]